MRGDRDGPVARALWPMSRVAARRLRDRGATDRSASRGLEALGAKITIRHGYVDLKAKRLRGGSFVFDTVTVGGTQNLMMAATLARGTSRLENVAREPEAEAEELPHILVEMGARITGAGSSVIEVEGVDELFGFDHAVVPDRIEAGTFAVAAAIRRGDVLLLDAPVDHMHATIAKLEEAGAEGHVEADGLRVIGLERLEPVDVSTRRRGRIPASRPTCRRR